VLDFVISLLVQVIGEVIIKPVLWAGGRIERWILGGAMERAGRRAGRLWGRLRRSLPRLAS
jgi:hypothetical protein